MAVQETASLAEAASTTEVPNGQSLTTLNVLTGIIIRPRATFKSLREMNRGYWWLAFLVTVAALLLYTVVSTSVTSSARQSFTPPAGAVTNGTANTNETTGANTNTPTFQITQPSLLITIGLPLMTGVMTLLLGYVFRSLIAFGASLVMGGHSTFKQTFRMAVWTTIPAIFRHVIQSIAVLTTQGRIISGLSGVMTTLETRSLPFLNMLLGQIDIYAVWSMILLGIGVAVTTRLSRGKSTIAVLIYIVVAIAGLLLYYVVSSAVGGLGGQRTPGAGGFGGGGGFRGPGG